MSKKEPVITGFMWRFLERCGAQGVTFVVSVILARLLDPTVYGTVALVSVFTAILQTFIDSGLGTALVQKKDADDLDFSSVFYFNFIICIALYIVVFFLAVPIARFYQKNELVPLVRVLGLTLIISGVKSIQQAFVSRHMIFKRFFFATLAGTIIAAVVGVAMAYNGYGVWALVAQNLTNNCIDTAILWVTVKWRPKKCFSFNRLARLWSFGWKILMASLIDRVYKELRSLIIGKKYSSADLAFYNKGEQYPGLVVDNIDTSIDSVLLPSMASVQDNKGSVKEITRRSLQIGSYVLMPVLMGLAVCAKPIIVLMLTEKWLPCVPFLRVFCYIYALRPLNTASLNAIKAMGRSDLILKMDILKKVFGITILLLTMYISPFAMVIGLAVNHTIALVINAYPNKKLLNYRYSEQVRDMFPAAAAACIMGTIVYSVTFLNLSDILTLLIQVPAGVIVYLLLSYLFKLDGYVYIMKKVKSLRAKV